MKHLRGILTAGAAVLGTGAGLVYLVAPGKAREEQKQPFFGQNLAHRGLYNMEEGRPENSLAAFRAAAEAGYGVELDTRMTKDGYIVVSHDGSVKRMTGADVTVEESTLAELQELRLMGTEERIPLFSDVLDVLCAANVPVVVEVKPSKQRDELCRRVLEIMDAHDGKLCVESFDPLTVAWFRFHAPDLLRGQLVDQKDNLGLSPLPEYLLSTVKLNFLARPQFIAHHVGKKSLSVRLCEAMGALRVCWTAHDRGEEDKFDAVIFEHFLPPITYK